MAGVWDVVALSLGVAGAGFASGSLTLAVSFSDRARLRLVALGAGTLLGACFLHILPEAIDEAGRDAALAALAGFLFLYVVERFVFTHPCEEDVCDFHKPGMLAYVGVTVHSAVDGLALGIGMLQPLVTVPIVVALVLHRIPTSFALASILVGGRFPRRTILSYLLVISLALPAGALASYLLLGRVLEQGPSRLLGGLLGFSAGTFLYLGASDLLPEIHKGEKGRTWVFLAVLAGIAVMALIGEMLH